MQREILKVLCDVIRSEMDLKADQVVIYNQRWKIPPDDRLYVSVGLTGTNVYAANRKYTNRFLVLTPSQTEAVFEENLSVNAQDVVTINVYSRSEAARLRRNEIVLAFTSTLCEREMELNSFHIGAVPVSYVDVSEGEGTTIINRYALTFNVLYATASSKPVEYIDSVKISPPVLQP